MSTLPTDNNFETYPRTRSEALMVGLAWYYTGKPCAQGHDTKRVAKTAQCWHCKILRSRNYDRKNLAKRRLQHRARRLVRFEAPMERQAPPPSCELCGKLPKTRHLNADHDHATKKFRGWLCTPCNTALGRLGDSIYGLQRAIEYLRRADAASS